MAANTWSSVASTDWDTDANWSLGHKPTAGETATFDATSVISCTLATDVTGIAMAIGTGYTGTLNLNGKAVTGGAGLDFTWNIGTGGTINMAASVVTCDGNFDWSGAAGAVTRGTSTLVMTGVGKSFNAPYNDAPRRSYQNLTIANGASITIGTAFHAGLLLTLNGTVSKASGTLQCSAMTQDVNGTMNGGALLYWQTGPLSLANPSAIAPAIIQVQYNVTLPPGIYSPTTRFDIMNVVAGDHTFTWSAGIYTFTSPFRFLQSTGGVNTFTVSGTNNPTLIFQSSVTVTQTTGTIAFTNNPTNPNQLTGPNNQTLNIAAKNMGTWLVDKPDAGTLTLTAGDTLIAGGPWKLRALVPSTATITDNGWVRPWPWQSDVTKRQTRPLCLGNVA